MHTRTYTQAHKSTNQTELKTKTKKYIMKNRRKIKEKTKQKAKKNRYKKSSMLNTMNKIDEKFPFPMMKSQLTVLVCNGFFDSLSGFKVVEKLTECDVTSVSTFI